MEKKKDVRLESYLEQWYDLVDEITKEQERLDILQGRLDVLEQNTIPNLLAEYGTKKLTASDGTMVEVTDKYTADVTKRNQKKASEILKRLGAGGIAKIEVTFGFTEHEKEGLKALLKYSKQEKLPSDIKPIIPAASLKKVVDQALKDGKLQPDELSTLGVFHIKKATIKEPKEK